MIWMKHIECLDEVYLNSIEKLSESFEYYYITEKQLLYSRIRIEDAIIWYYMKYLTGKSMKLRRILESTNLKNFIQSLLLNKIWRSTVMTQNGPVELRKKKGVPHEGRIIPVEGRRSPDGDQHATINHFENEPEPSREMGVQIGT